MECLPQTLRGTFPKNYPSSPPVMSVILRKPLPFHCILPTPAFSLVFFLRSGEEGSRRHSGKGSPSTTPTSFWQWHKEEVVIFILERTCVLASLILPVAWDWGSWLILAPCGRLCFWSRTWDLRSWVEADLGSVQSHLRWTTEELVNESRFLVPLAQATLEI